MKKELATLNKIVILYDIINQYTTELKPDLRHNLKKLTNNADNSLRLLIKQVDNIIKNRADDFGHDADELREYIDKFYKE